MLPSALFMCDLTFNQPSTVVHFTLKNEFVVELSRSGKQEYICNGATGSFFFNELSYTALCLLFDLYKIKLLSAKYVNANCKV